MPKKRQSPESELRRALEEGKIAFKAAPFFITKIDADLGIVEAIVSVFGVVDLGGDMIMPGAFSKTIVENTKSIRVCDLHNTFSIFNVLGMPTQMKEVGREELPEQVRNEFPTATGGLWTQTQYLIDTPEGKGAFARIKAGAINEYSIGYQVLDWNYDEILIDGKKVRIRILRSIKLWEYSPVIWGMNQATATSDVKEYTADGAIARFGDYFHGELLECAHRCLDDRYAYGFFSLEEYNKLLESVTSQLAAMRSGMDEDIALRPLWSGMMFYDSSDPDVGVKAGRVLSAANASRLKEMYENLTNILTTAGVIGDEPDDATAEDEEADDAKATDVESAGPSEPEGSVVTPTDERRKALEARAELIDRKIKLTTGEES